MECIICLCSQQTVCDYRKEISVSDRRVKQAEGGARSMCVTPKTKKSQEIIANAAIDFHC